MREGYGLASRHAAPFLPEETAADMKVQMPLV